MVNSPSLMDKSPLRCRLFSENTQRNEFLFQVHNFTDLVLVYVGLLVYDKHLTMATGASPCGGLAWRTGTGEVTSRMLRL